MASNDAQIAAIRECFDMFDKDGSGDIDVKEFQALSFMSGRVLTDEQAEALVAELDTDHSGKIEFAEFLSWFQGNAGSDVGSDDAPFLSVPGELRLLRARLMRDYSLKMLDHYVGNFNTPSSGLAAKAAQSKPFSAKLDLLAGKHADADDDEANRTELKFSIQDQATNDAVRARVSALGGDANEDFDKEKAVFVEVDLATKPGADAEAIAATLQGLFALLPFQVAKAAAVDGHLRLSLGVMNGKTEKVSDMAGMANLQTLSLVIKAWPKPSRVKAAEEDLALALSFNASLPAHVIDMFSAMMRGKPQPIVALFTALKVASLRFQYDHVADIAGVLPKGFGKSFVEEGGWEFLHTLITKTIAPMIAFLPEEFKDAYTTIIDGLLAPTNVSVSVSKDVCFGVAFKNFEMFQLFPGKDEFAAAAEAAEAELKAAMEAAAAEEAARIEAAAQLMVGMEGEKVMMRSMYYAVSGGTDATFTFNRKEESDGEIESSFTLDPPDFIPASMTSTGQTIPFEFIQATLSNFFEQDFNFSDEGSLFSIDGDKLHVKLLSAIHVKDDGFGCYVGPNDWPNVVITFPINKKSD